MSSSPIADRPASSARSGQLWKSFVDALVFQFGSSGENEKLGAKWFMPAAQGLAATFAPSNISDRDERLSDQDQDDAEISNFNLAVFDFANRIPLWALPWSADGDGDFYRTYSDFVQQLQLLPVMSGTDLSSAQAELHSLEIKLASFTNEIAALKREFDQKYKTQHTTINDSGKDVWRPGYCPGTMARAWHRYRTSSDYKTQVENAVHTRYQDLRALIKSRHQILRRIYGAPFDPISEAQNNALKADPDLSLWDASDFQDRVHFQMKAGSDSWLPLYVGGASNDKNALAAYKRWLKNAQKSLVDGKKPKYSFSFDSSMPAQQTSEIRLLSESTVAIEDVLLIDGGETHKLTSVKSEAFKLDVSYHDLFLVALHPGYHWYNPRFLATYAEPRYFPVGSPFRNEPLGGPSGLFNLQVVGVMVGIGRSITFRIDNLAKYKWSKSLTSSANVSLLGLVHLGSANDNFAATELNTSETSFQIKDTSGTPSIVGLVVSDLFAPPS